MGKLSLGTLGVLQADLTGTFRYANYVKEGKKIKVSVKFWLHFFSFPVVEILRLSNAAIFCIFKNIVLSVIEFGRELCFPYFHFVFLVADTQLYKRLCPSVGP